MIGALHHSPSGSAGVPATNVIDCGIDQTSSEHAQFFLRSFYSFISSHFGRFTVVIRRTNIIYEGFSTIGDFRE